MPSNIVVPMILDLVLLITGIGYSLAILFPRLGVRLLGRYAPNLYNLFQKRLAVIRGTAFGLTFLIIGIAGLLRDSGAVSTNLDYQIGVAFLIVIGMLIGMNAHIRLNRP